MLHRDDVYRRFGALLTMKRKSAGVSQAKLAELVGLSRTSITNIEAGNQPVQLHQLYVLAAALHVSVIDLLPSTDQSPVPDLNSYTQALRQLVDVVTKR